MLSYEETHCWQWVLHLVSFRFICLCLRRLRCRFSLFGDSCRQQGDQRGSMLSALNSGILQRDALCSFSMSEVYNRFKCEQPLVSIGYKSSHSFTHAANFSPGKNHWFLLAASHVYEAQNIQQREKSLLWGAAGSGWTWGLTTFWFISLLDVWQYISLNILLCKCFRQVFKNNVRLRMFSEMEVLRMYFSKHLEEPTT